MTQGGRKVARIATTSYLDLVAVICDISIWAQERATYKQILMALRLLFLVIYSTAHNTTPKWYIGVEQTAKIETLKYYQVSSNKKF
jgi:hypothetical protein